MMQCTIGAQSLISPGEASSCRDVHPHVFVLGRSAAPCCRPPAGLALSGQDGCGTKQGGPHSAVGLGRLHLPSDAHANPHPSPGAAYARVRASPDAHPGDRRGRQGEMARRRGLLPPPAGAAARAAGPPCCCLPHALALLPQLPADVKLNYFDAEGNMQEVAVGSLTKGKKVGCCCCGGMRWPGRRPAAPAAICPCCSCGCT